MRKKITNSSYVAVSAQLLLQKRFYPALLTSPESLTLVAESALQGNSIRKIYCHERVSEQGN